MVQPGLEPWRPSLEDKNGDHNTTHAGKFYILSDERVHVFVCFYDVPLRNEQTFTQSWLKISLDDIFSVMFIHLQKN